MEHDRTTLYAQDRTTLYARDKDGKIYAMQFTKDAPKEVRKAVVNQILSAMTPPPNHKV